MNGTSSAPCLTRLALAAVGRLVPPAPEPRPPEFQLLASAAAESPSDAVGFSAAVRQAQLAPALSDVPLARLASAWNLSTAETLSLALAAAVERDLMVGRALAYAQAPIGGSRPTLALLVSAFSGLDEARPLTPARLVHSPAFLRGALALAQDGSPLPERGVAVPLPLCGAFDDEDVPWPGGRIDEALSAPLPDSVRQQCRLQALALSRSAAPALVVRAGLPEEARSAAGQIARELGLRPFFIENVATSGLGAWLLLRDLAPVFIVDAGPGETKTLPEIPGFAGPILVAASRDGSLVIPGRAVTPWLLPMPTLDERSALWRAFVTDDSAARELAGSHRASPARIAQLGRLAAHQARLDGASDASVATIRAVARTGEGTGLEALAQPVLEPIADDALVLGQELRAELEGLLARCRHRDGLTARLGPATAARYTTGVRALLVGPSGTGKTLAAGWLATRLGLPLYRVDLSAIHSKYIGETEKNLAQLMARAERTEAVLLFDEADALFGKRTDVRDSNDRFANTQTNYLLQRIETFDGIALLTSNSRGRFDAAFSRRLDVVIEFPAPGPAERRALWQAHLGAEHTLSIQELNLIAGQCDFAGGQIRNVVLAAAVAARDQGEVVDYSRISHALQAEYRKAGRPPPPALGRNAG